MSATAPETPIARTAAAEMLTELRDIVAQAVAAGSAGLAPLLASLIVEGSRVMLSSPPPQPSWLVNALHGEHTPTGLMR